VRTRHEMHLSLRSINISQDQLHLSEIGQPLRLPHEPVSILIEVLGTFTLVFVGTGNGKVLIYSFEDSTMLLSEVSIDVENGDDLSKAIESLAVVATDTDGPSQKYTILCGLRSGILVPFEMTLGHGDKKCAIGTLNLTLNLRASLIGVFFFFLEVKQTSSRRIGNTSVKMQSRGHFALLTCGRGFWQASCSRKDGVLDPNLHLQRIWVTDQNNVRLHSHLQTPLLLLTFCSLRIIQATSTVSPWQRSLIQTSMANPTPCSASPTVSS
jgi:hypothetical protein